MKEMVIACMVIISQVPQLTWLWSTQEGRGTWLGHYHLSWPVFSPTSKWSLFPSSPFAHLMVEIVIMGILFHTPKLFYHLRTNCKSDPIATDLEHLRIHLMWDGASLMVRIWIWEISSLFFLCWIWIWNIWLFLFYGHIRFCLLRQELQWL